MDKEINIAYETLFELLRREKTREEIQKIDEGFFNNVIGYLNEERELIKKLRIKQDLFASEELRKAEIKDENVRKIIRELYEKRERKIINLALDCSRTDSSIIDTSHLLKEEKVFYECIVELFNRFRKGLLFNLLRGEKIDENICYKDFKENEKFEEDSSINLIEPGVEGDGLITESLIKLKFASEIPKFVGQDMKEYGPYSAGQIEDIPLAIADIFLKSGNAERVV